MKDIKRIVIIYNPKSTGKSERNAKSFQKRARKKLKIPVEVIATEGRGHARTMAKKIANDRAGTMIISSSGDGGYNEVVNGVLESKNPSSVLGLLPSGNANDHYHYVHHGDVLKRIQRGSVEFIDVLKITTTSGLVAYAHSYAGLGMTSEINDVLMQYAFKPFREISLVVRNMFRIRPVNVLIDGRAHQLDNLIFLNSGRMSKIIKNRSRASICDGEFEVVRLKSGAVLQLIRYFFHAVTVGFYNAKSYRTFTFTCQHDMGIQLDGERLQLFAGNEVTVTCEHRALRVII